MVMLHEDVGRVNCCRRRKLLAGLSPGDPGCTVYVLTIDKLHIVPYNAQVFFFYSDS